MHTDKYRQKRTLTIYTYHHQISASRCRLLFVGVLFRPLSDHGVCSGKRQHIHGHVVPDICCKLLGILLS